MRTRSLYYRIRKMAKVHKGCPVEMVDGWQKPTAEGHLSYTNWRGGRRYEYHESTLKLVVGKEWFFANMNEEEQEIYRQQALERLGVK